MIVAYVTKYIECQINVKALFSNHYFYDGFKNYQSDDKLQIFLYFVFLYIRNVLLDETKEKTNAIV